ncbi:unnamed protein product [Prorocentrum cordatum]|uniref:Uncharacterized protein n=1 Tax=Prorocentrum cordatum TaxID=2364126 RepID=A0ABN9YEA5_9DINO|nr:unnamed protein product [Polarella glacialis]
MAPLARLSAAALALVAAAGAKVEPAGAPADTALGDLARLRAAVIGSKAFTQKVDQACASVRTPECAAKATDRLFCELLRRSRPEATGAAGCGGAEAPPSFLEVGSRAAGPEDDLGMTLTRRERDAFFAEDRRMALPRGARAAPVDLAALVVTAVGGAVDGGAPRRIVAAVACSAVSAAAGVRPGVVADAALRASSEALRARRRRRRQRRAGRRALERGDAAAMEDAAVAGVLPPAEPPAAAGDPNMDVDGGCDDDVGFDDTWADKAASGRLELNAATVAVQRRQRLRLLIPRWRWRRMEQMVAVMVAAPPADAGGGLLRSSRRSGG